jgi:hypothetical protein
MLGTHYPDGGTAVAQWLRYCATNQKIAGSIPDGVMEFFIDINPSDRTMALGSTQPLPPSCAVVKKSGNLNFLEPSGPLQACNGTALPLPLHTILMALGSTQPLTEMSTRSISWR